ncbi:MAG: metalloregulator ArsR/SmtB family transcription factor [Acidimicrobiales bacterium]
MDAAFKAMAEPRRREILRLVWSEELPATQIAARFDDVTRSAVSQHLGVLRDAGLVVERREGTRRMYRVNHREMARMRTFLDDYWTGSLERLRDLSEAAVPTGRTTHTPAAEQPRDEPQKGIQSWPN